MSGVWDWMPLSERGVALGLAVLLDLLGGEPPSRLHPVAWLGSLAGWLERRAPEQSPAGRLCYGASLTTLLVGGSGLLGVTAEALARRLPALPRLALLTLALNTSFSLRDLARAAHRVERALAACDLCSAHEQLRALVSRPTGDLSEAGAASAAIESLAENLSDSVVAPLLYYLGFGLAGAWAYRAANTLDAMIGYHGEYEQLGKAAARVDDLLNLLPARLSALTLVAAAWAGGGDGPLAWATLRRDAARTESPNAGWPMSAAAGALEVKLEKTGRYRLGAGFPEPSPSDISRAVRLYYASAALAIGVALLSQLRRRAALAGKVGTFTPFPRGEGPPCAPGAGPRVVGGLRARRGPGG